MKRSNCTGTLSSFVTVLHTFLDAPNEHLLLSGRYDFLEKLLECTSTTLFDTTLLIRAELAHGGLRRFRYGRERSGDVIPERERNARLRKDLSKPVHARGITADQLSDLSTFD
jgi:hypothetical protein